MSRGVEQRGNWPVRPEQDVMLLRSMTIRLSRDFRDVRWLLTKPYDEKYQTPIETRLRTSTGRVIAIGLIEQRNGDPTRPRFTRFHEEWHGNRDKAVGVGYEVKTFGKYLEQKAAKSNSALIVLQDLSN